MFLFSDINLEDNAFNTASQEMSALLVRAQNLKTELQSIYQDVVSALDTPTGMQLQLLTDKVLIQPIDDLILVIQQMSSTLNIIIEKPYYKTVFDNHSELIEKIKNS